MDNEQMLQSSLVPIRKSLFRAFDNAPMECSRETATEAVSVDVEATQKGRLGTGESHTLIPPRHSL